MNTLKFELIPFSVPPNVISANKMSQQPIRNDFGEKFNRFYSSTFYRQYRGGYNKVRGLLKVAIS